jgi:hypothetical protein
MYFGHSGGGGSFTMMARRVDGRFLRERGFCGSVFLARSFGFGLWTGLDPFFKKKLKLKKVFSHIVYRV